MGLSVKSGEIPAKEKGALGYPISDEMDFAEGGRVSIFQNGSIYWWPDTGPILLKEVIVNYTGFICFGETDEFSDSDEPYVIFGVISPDGTSTSKTRYTTTSTVVIVVLTFWEFIRANQMGLRSVYC